MAPPIARMELRARKPLGPLASPSLSDRLVEALPNGVVALDGDGRIQFMNAAAELMFRASRGHCLGKSLTELVPHDSPLVAVVAEARSRQATVTDADIRIEGPRFAFAHAAIEASPINDGTAGIVVTIKDRQSELRMAKQSAADNAAQSVRSVALMLAHEIKNPLSGIRGAAQLLETRVAEDDVGLAELIREETDRIVALVNGMEVFADDRPATMNPLNVHEALEHARRVAAHGFAKHVTFRVAFDPSLPLLRANRDQLIQVFLNLIKNAAEAAPAQGGEIVLSTSFQPGLRIGERSGGHGGRRIVVSISDNGCGVPERLRASLFDPFVSGRANGKGLGLALVARLVRLHGGLIDYDSEPGRTVFSLYLPIAPQGSRWE